MKKENMEVVRIVSKADRLMTRLENSVSETKKAGFVQNAYGAFYKPEKFQAILELMTEAEKIDPSDHNTPYLKAGYLAWAGRLEEAEALYLRVADLDPNLACFSFNLAANVQASRDNMGAALESASRYNECRPAYMPELTEEVLSRKVYQEVSPPKELSAQSFDESNKEDDYVVVALGFGQALADHRFDDAIKMLTRDAQKKLSATDLKASYQSMFMGEDAVSFVEVISDMDDWPAKQPADRGWVYVALATDSESEAMTVIVCDEDGELRIRDIEWGRP